MSEKDEADHVVIHEERQRSKEKPAVCPTPRAGNKRRIKPVIKLTHMISQVKLKLNITQLL